MRWYSPKMFDVFMEEHGDAEAAATVDNDEAVRLIDGHRMMDMSDNAESIGQDQRHRRI